MTEDILSFANLNVNIKIDNGIKVFHIKGRFDFQTIPHARSFFFQHTENSEKIILNLEKLEYIDSAALGLIMGLVQKVTNNKSSLRVSGPQEQIMAVLRLSKVANFLKIDKTLEESIKNLG